MPLPTFKNAIDAVVRATAATAAALAQYEVEKKRLDVANLAIHDLCRGMADGTLIEVAGTWYRVTVDTYERVTLKLVTIYHKE